MRFNSYIPRVTSLAIATAALLSAGSAMAAETLYGGGATFPAVPYVGNAYLAQNPDARLSTNSTNTAGAGFTTSGISSGSIFATYSTGNLISYCQTGSGFGKGVLNGATAANGQCKDFSVTNPAGFSGAAPSPNTAIADFIGTDAPYSTSDYNAFNSSTLLASRVGITQIPTIAGAIGLPHYTASGGLVDKYNLTTAAVCQIYSNKISTWAQVNTLLGTNSGSTGTIKIIYRLDGSGTTFAFTSFLAAKCNGTANVPTGFSFAPNQSFDTAVGGVTTRYGAGRATSASGNNGVVSTTKTTVDAIGYADIGEVVAQTAEYDLVNNFDPTQFGASGVKVTIDPAGTSGGNANLLAGKVLDGAVIGNAPGSQSATVKNCLRLVNPGATISNVYPIAAITYIASYYGGNGTAAHIQAIKDLYNRFYTTGTRVTLPMGFAYIDGNATFRTQIQSSINSCTN